MSTVAWCTSAVGATGAGARRLNGVSGVIHPLAWSRLARSPKPAPQYCACSRVLPTMPMSWTMKRAGMRPSTPEVMMMSFADRHAGMLSRIKFLMLIIINTSASARVPDWMRLSP
eukprot:1246115-Pyramimonas_sp.AAC.1